MKNKSFLAGLIITIILNLFFLTGIILCCIFGFTMPYSTILITGFMFAYHCDIRTLIAKIFTFFCKKRVNLSKKTYKISKKEFNFLNRLGVKKWKDSFVAWDKKQFVIKDLRNRENLEIVLRNNISAEVIHWICFIASFFSILFGCLMSLSEWWIYLVTAIVVPLLIDLPPILIQRFNRFRLQKFFSMQSKIWMATFIFWALRVFFSLKDYLKDFSC